MRPAESARTGRELALRALFQVDMADISPEEALTAAREDDPYGEESVKHARDLLLGFLAQHARVDEVIERYARGWTLARMANVDRNILRLATYEMLFSPIARPVVTVNAAIELAKKYSTAESHRFVNGILGALARSLEEERSAVSGERGAPPEARGALPEE